MRQMDLFVSNADWYLIVVWRGQIMIGEDDGYQTQVYDYNDEETARKDAARIVLTDNAERVTLCRFREDRTPIIVEKLK